MVETRPRFRVAALAAVWLALAASAFAQDPGPGPVDLGASPPGAGPAAEAPLPGLGSVVAEVRVSGNRRIEADAVKAVVATKVGEKLSQKLVAEDIKRIYALGFFHDVRVEIDRAPGGGAIVTYDVVENPVIRQVSISGNEEIASDDIKEKLTITVGSTVDYPLLLENKARIEAQYQAQGYYQAQVTYVLEPQGEGSVGVNFDVVEGKKLKLREVDFRGNEALSDSELRGAMQTKPWTITSWVTQMWDTSGLYAEPLFYQDLDKIQRMYMDKGYIRVQLGEPQVEVTDDGIQVAVDVTEGAQYRVGTIDVLGDETMDRDSLLGLIEQKPGEVFSRSTLTGDVDRLRGFYGDRGFYDASVNPITQVDPEKLTVACNFEVKKGELYFVDGIDLHGNTRTADTVVRRELSIAEGDLYSAEAVQRSKQRVQRLGYFEEVEIAAKPSDEPHRVAMAIDLVERPTGSFSFGAGFGSVDGFIISGSVRQDNLFGTGRALSAGLDLGSINRSFYVRFVEPYVFGTVGSMAITAQNATSEYIDFEETLSGASINYSYPLDESYTYLSTGYAYSAREIGGFESFQAASLLEREEFQGETSSSLATISLRRDTRDDLRFPTSGNVTGIAFEFAGLGGFSQFLRMEARTSQFYPLQRWLRYPATFVFNSRIGYVVPWNEISDFDLPGCGTPVCTSTVAQVDYLQNIDSDLTLPLTERYFLGGIGAFQLRGYKQRSLGPRRTILNLATNVPPQSDLVFTPFGRETDPSLPEFGQCRPGNFCNDIDDQDVDDFENIDATDVIGGNSMMLMNFEVDFPISEEMGLSGIVFLDMGNAFAENEFINPAEFRYGTGAGIQWFSPFGPIMVIIGFPLNPLEDEESSVFEFSLGGQQY